MRAHPIPRPEGMERVRGRIAELKERFREEGGGFVGVLAAVASGGGKESEAAGAIRAAAVRYGIDPAALSAVAEAESGFRPDAVSPKGAVGVMQVMPQTAASYGVSREELFDPDICIRVGLTYFKEMLHQFERVDLALAAYNAGPTRVVDAGHRIPRIRETVDYVRRVENAAVRFGSAQQQ